MQANCLTLLVCYAEISSQKCVIEKLPHEQWASGQIMFSRDSHLLLLKDQPNLGPFSCVSMGCCFDRHSWSPFRCDRT